MENSRKYMIMGVVLTALLVVIITGWLLISYFAYGKEWADYDEMYHTDKGVAVFLDDALKPHYGVIEDGQVYLPVSAVKSMLNDRFYVSIDNELFYTLPDETVEIAPGQRQWTIGGVVTETDWPVCFTAGDELYVAVEYVAELTDIHYTWYQEPDRLMIYRGSRDEDWSQVTKKAQVRYLAGRKALILDEVKPGDQVCILGVVDDWTQVRTESGFVGYLPTKVLGALSTTSVQTDYIPQDYTGVAGDEKVCLAWHQVFTVAANQYLTEFLAETEGLTVISPTWFALSDEDGGFSSLAESWYVEEAHGRGLEVWALINDFDREVDKYELLSRTESRRTLIANLIAEALEYDLDGINIDFELIDEATGEHFVQFIRELSVECRRHGLVLSIDNYSLIGGRWWYDLKEQGTVADYVIMMGYDEHWSGGEPGSTASIGFTRQTMDLALDQVPADKLIHGIPFYTRVWGEAPGASDSSIAAGMEEAKRLLTENGAKLQWLEEEGQYFGQYLLDGVMYSIWLEDTASLELKLQAVTEAGVAGLACWKLGLEDPAVWPLIADYLK